MKEYSFLRKFILFPFRSVLGLLYNRISKSAMPSGIECKVHPFQNEKYHGDILHPCIRYIEEGFAGHKWWMVVTPYYKADSSIENPILYYGIEEGDTVPIEWEPIELIVDTPNIGYNSDPTLFFEAGKMYVLWRECKTEKAKKYHCVSASFGVELSFENFRIKKKYLTEPLLFETRHYSDRGLCPTIIRYKNKYRCYSVDYRFYSPLFYSKRKELNNLLRKLFWCFSMVNFYQEKKSNGIAIWESEMLGSKFEYKRTVKIKNVNALYNPWHYDFFEYNQKLFIIVQTNQSASDLCLGVSVDYENFELFAMPLLSNYSNQYNGLYKSTGLIHKDTFYLFYTIHDKNRKNCLYLSKIHFPELLDKLK